jgi:hypothetical protein
MAWADGMGGYSGEPHGKTPKPDAIKRARAPIFGKFWSDVTD